MPQILVDGLLGLLKIFREDRLRKDVQRELALSALITATTETKIYISRVQKTGRKDREIEEKLCRLWGAAAIPLGTFNHDLAERCLMKSFYWVNPDNFSISDMVQFRLGIEQICKEARDML
jgi:hypothetical protein